MRINGTTKLVGLIGWPIHYTMSPRMHNAAYAHLGMDYVYVPLRVDPRRETNLRDALFGLTSLGFVGANVTIPYKQAVIPLLDSLSETAQQAHSVNTIVVGEDGSLHGDSTDGEGFMRDLARCGFIDVAQAHIAMVGAGGAARAIACSVAQARCKELTIINRNHVHAQHLVENLRANFSSTKFFHEPLDLLTTKAMADFDLIINCTPPNSVSEIILSPNNFVYDTNYMHDATNFKYAAERSQARFVDGMGMLLNAGAVSFSAFTNTQAPLDVMQAHLVGNDLETER